MKPLTFEPRPRALRICVLRNLMALGLLAALAAVSAAPVAADPPPWAPAHGWRAKQHHKHKHHHKDHAQHHRHHHKHKHKHRYGHEHYALRTAPYGLDLGRCNREVLGAVLGGAAGATIGSTVDKNDGRTAAVIGGTIIGVLVGGAIGRHLDNVDQNCIGQALEHVPDGETIVWRNPNKGGSYELTPEQTYRQVDGRYCRDYVTEVLIDGRRQQAYGTACRQPDGSWKVVRI